MTLEQLGWTPAFASHFDQLRQPTFVPGRIACERGNLWTVWTQQADYTAELTGKLRHAAGSRADLPAVGDWVAIVPRPGESAAMIHAVLPRCSRFSRKVAGAATEEQIVAANIDTLLLVCGLDHDFNPRRIERYLAPAYESGASPVLVLNKADLCPDLEERLAQVQSVAPGLPVHAVSAAEGRNIEPLHRYLTAGRTVALVGSSGVGKSTLINRLVGQARQRTASVRGHDSHGRHTTTHRELILLESGGLIIDTPGMRELQLWSDESGLSEMFDDIEQLAARCRFRDCRHGAEPGCAIRAALEEGSLAPDRYESYRKLQREQHYLELRQNQRVRQDERARWKQIAQFQKQLKKRSHKFR